MCVLTPVAALDGSKPVPTYFIELLCIKECVESGHHWGEVTASSVIEHQIEEQRVRALECPVTASSVPSAEGLNESQLTHLRSLACWLDVSPGSCVAGRAGSHNEDEEATYFDL